MLTKSNKKLDEVNIWLVKMERAVHREFRIVNGQIMDDIFVFQRNIILEDVYRYLQGNELFNKLPTQIQFQVKNAFIGWITLRWQNIYCQISSRCFLLSFQEFQFFLLMNQQ